MRSTLAGVLLLTQMKHYEFALVDGVKRLLARAFSIMFLAAAAALAVLCAVDFVHAMEFSREKDVIGGIVAAVNTAFIALATFELGIGIGREYTLPEAGADLYPLVRRTITRFVSVACIALVLESLILVIKYSQLELVANLIYPVAVMAGASGLLIALGVFIHLSRPDASPDPVGASVYRAQARHFTGVEASVDRAHPEHQTTGPIPGGALDGMPPALVSPAAPARPRAG